MRKGKYSMHARLFENYKNGMILAQASKQASKQATIGLQIILNWF